MVIVVLCENEIFVMIRDRAEVSKTWKTWKIAISLGEKTKELGIKFEKNQSYLDSWKEERMVVIIY